VRAW